MKLFETPLDSFHFLGLEYDECSKTILFNKKFFILMFLCVLCMILSILSIIYDTKSFYEYTILFIVFLSGAVDLIIFCILKLNVNILIKFIENFQNVFDKSKLKQFIIVSQSTIKSIESSNNFFYAFEKQIHTLKDQDIRRRKKSWSRPLKQWKNGAKS